MKIPCRHPSKPIFKFDLSVQAAKKNFLILTSKFGGGLQKAIDAQQGSPLWYGSEFKPVHILASWPQSSVDILNGKRWKPFY
jgi:hypothetical protein